MTRRSFRIVSNADQIHQVEALLRAEGYAFEPDLFFESAYRLSVEPKSLGHSLAAFFGYIYIQDRASMLPPLALQPPQGARVLDMCASPGSKTGQLAQMVGSTGLVLGNEPSPARLATLRRNMHTQGLLQTVTTCYSAESLPLPSASWSYIQLDPPCSGWGTVERNPKVMELWKDDKILPLIRLQRQLLTEAARLLQPGGRLVFSTCTTNAAENEEQVAFALNTLGLEPEALPKLSGFALEKPCPVPGLPAAAHSALWRVLPLEGDTQGFFVARMRKPGAAATALPGLPSALPDAERLAVESISDEILRQEALEPKLLPPGRMGIFGDSLHFVPQLALEHLPRSLRWQGLYVGKAAGLHFSPRLRLPLTGATLNLAGQEGIASLRALLQGQSLVRPKNAENKEQPKAKHVTVLWEGLTLGRLRVKGDRLLWTER